MVFKKSGLGLDLTGLEKIGGLGLVTGLAASLPNTFIPWS